MTSFKFGLECLESYRTISDLILFELEFLLRIASHPRVHKLAFEANSPTKNTKILIIF